MLLVWYWYVVVMVWYRMAWLNIGMGWFVMVCYWCVTGMICYFMIRILCFVMLSFRLDGRACLFTFCHLILY